MRKEKGERRNNRAGHECASNFFPFSFLLSFISRQVNKVQVDKHQQLSTFSFKF